MQVETSSNHVVDWLQTVGARIVAHLEAAQGDGDEALAQVRPDGPLAAPTVTLHIDEARTEGEAEVMAFTWAATGPSGPFARLIGTVRVVALDSSRTEVSVSGRYRAPREYSGGPLDPAALALVAEATLRSLLLRLARVMERP